jgi:hypothetical protein
MQEGYRKTTTQGEHEEQHTVSRIANKLANAGDTLDLQDFLTRYKRDAENGLKKVIQDSNAQEDRYQKNNEVKLFDTEDEHRITPTEIQEAILKRSEQVGIMPDSLKGPYATAVVESVRAELLACEMDNVCVEDVINTLIQDESTKLHDAGDVDDMLNDIRARATEIAYTPPAQEA